MLKARKRIRNEALSSVLSTNLIFRCHPFFSWYYGHSSSYFTDGHLLLQAYTIWSILEIKHKVLRYGQSRHLQYRVIVCRGHFWAIRHHCLLETTSVGAMHPELQVGFIGHLHHSLFPPATALFPLWKKKTGKKKWYKNLEINAETFGFRCFRARWYQCLAAVGHSTRQNLPPDLDYLSKRALRHIKTIQRYIFTYDIKLPRLPPYRNTGSQILSWFIKVKLKCYKCGKI